MAYIPQEVLDAIPEGAEVYELEVGSDETLLHVTVPGGAHDRHLLASVLEKGLPGIRSVVTPPEVALAIMRPMAIRIEFRECDVDGAVIGALVDKLTSDDRVSVVDLTVFGGKARG